MTTDLDRLKVDLDTATPRRTPAWTDGLSVSQLRAIEERVAENRNLRRLISERPLGAGRGK